ncbi:unnamed protein product [Cuscuta campestris]|uniref:Uncharacterized protein n=1 Tax=Cuscuta campestris TaxID=132261 RepID=A0A484LH48_9ASTE|nr:unnamed protein product [Cuscuta campestris]
METGVLKLYHGGVFVKTPSSNNFLQYLGGKCQDYTIDPDLIDFFHLLNLAKESGQYQIVVKLYYLKPKMSLVDGLTLVTGDNEVLAISKIMREMGSVCLYVVHHESEVGTQNLSNKSQMPNFPPNRLLNYEKDIGSNPVDESDDIYGVCSDDDDCEAKDMDILIGEDSDTSDDEFVNAKKSATAFEIKRNKKAQKVQEEIIRGRRSNVWNKATMHRSTGEDDHLSEYDESDGDVMTPRESDEDEENEGIRTKSSLPVINKYTDFTKLTWVVGMRFSNREAFRDAVVRYALAQGKNLTFCKSDVKKNQRLGVGCVDGCPFKLFASWESRRGTFLLKAVNNTHLCTRDMMANRQLKSSWLAKDFLEVFKIRPHWPAKEIVDAVRKKYLIIIKKCVAYKIKYLAHKLLHGSMKEHYGKLSCYIEACRQTNPESNFEFLTLNVGRNPAVFQRLFNIETVLGTYTPIGKRHTRVMT